MSALFRYPFLAVLVFAGVSVVSGDWGEFDDDDWGWNSPMAWGAFGGGWGNNLYQPQPQQQFVQPQQRFMQPQQQFVQSQQQFTQPQQQFVQPQQQFVQPQRQVFQPQRQHVQHHRQQVQPFRQVQQHHQQQQQQWSSNPFMASWLMNEYLDW